MEDADKYELIPSISNLRNDGCDGKPIFNECTKVFMSFQFMIANREIISLLMFFLPPLLLFAKRFPATYIPFNRKRYTLLSIIAIVRKELVYAYGLVNSDFFWLTYSPLTRSFSHPRTPLIYSLNMWGCFNQTVLNV